MTKIIPLNQSYNFEIGGKGEYLLRLSKLGFLIPRSWVIPSWVIEPYYAKYHKNEDLDQTFKDIAQTNLFKELCHEIENLKKETHIMRFAVRSSHSIEDGKKRSFSGLFYTELNIGNTINIVRAILKCWKQSLKFKYKNYFGDEYEQKPCSVILQEFIDSDFAGVTFKDNNKLFINNTYGLAKSIVDGSTGGDLWIIDLTYRRLLKYNNDKDYGYIPIMSRTNPLLQKKIDYRKFKDLKVAETNNNSSILKVAFNDKLKKEKTLSTKLIQELIDDTLRISTALSLNNCDIEWAIRNNILYILQARPLTHKIHFSFNLDNSVNSGLGLVKGKYSGRPYLVRSESDAATFPTGGILVTDRIEGAKVSAAMRAGACVTTSRSLLSHSAIIAREIGIPAIGAVDINKIDFSKFYSIDGDRGILFESSVPLKKSSKRKNIISSKPPIICDSVKRIIKEYSTIFLQ